MQRASEPSTPDAANAAALAALAAASQDAADLIRIDPGDPSDSIGSIHSPEPVRVEGEPEADTTDDPWAEPTDHCPNCGVRMEVSGVQCLHCGYNRSLGRVVQTQVHQAHGLERLLGAGPAALALAGGVALVCAGVWAGLVTVTGRPLSWIAVVVAVAATLVLADMQGGRSRRMGVAAVALTVAALVLAKLLIAAFGVPHLAARDVVEDPRLLAGAVYEQMLEARQFPPELQEAIDQVASGRGRGLLIDQMPGSLSVRVEQAVERQLAEMDALSREQAALRLLGRHAELRNPGLPSRAAVSGWDLVWFAAAIYVAFRLGSGRLELGARRSGEGRS